MKQRRYTKTIFFLLVLGLSIKLEAQTISKTVTIIHGGLSSAINDTNKKTIKSLVINGTIDVRDFVTIRDNMPAISELDLSGTTIAEYTETVNGNANIYQANTIPSFAFFNLTTNYSKDSLTTFIFPKSVTKIGSHAFQHCSELHSLLISSEITSIEFFAFGGCSALLSVDPQNTYYSSSSGILFNKDQTTLIQVPTSITGYYSIPQTTTKIGEFAFAGCDKVTSVYIPSSVISIGGYAFMMLTIKAITVSSSSPIDFVSTSNTPFNGIDYNYCTLYVPQGSVTKYKLAFIY